MMISTGTTPSLRIVAAWVVAVLVLLPAAGLCCLLTCAATAHQAAAAASHCEASTAAPGAPVLVTGNACAGDIAAASADLARPSAPVAVDAVPAVDGAAPPADVRISVQGAALAVRIPSRASPLKPVLRI